MPKSRKFLKVFSIIIISSVLFVFLLYEAAELTSKPSFCATCHFMEPYVEDWKTSSHANVTCTNCHFPPGMKSKLKGKFTAASMVINYFTGVYKRSKPWAEIEDASCLRSGCHVKEQLNKDLLFKQNIHFNHDSHLNNLRRNKKLRCTSCHSQIVQGEHMTVTETTCYLCHFKNQGEEQSMDDCTWCHSAPVTQPDTIPKYDHSFVNLRQIECSSCHGQMVIGDGEVLENRCSFCHAETGKLEKFAEAEFIHKMHVTEHKVECANCHLEIQHKSIARTEDIFPDCQECHKTPHLAQFDLFSGSGGKDVKDHPNPMFTAGLNCQACHIYHESEFGMSGKTFASGKSCEKCHGAGYAQLYTQWENNMQSKIGLVEIGLGVVKSKLNLNGQSNQTSFKIKQLLSDAQYNYQLVKTGNVVHNVAYSDELLVKAYSSIREILETIGADTSLPSIKLFNTTKPSNCQNCHYGQENRIVEAFGIQFDHARHIENKDLKCLTCHSHKISHGNTVASRDMCLSCHHSQQETHCLKCHQVQTHFYDGTIEIANEILPDYMYEADIECTECHENDDGIISKIEAQNCSKCHEDEYNNMFVEWQTEVNGKINNINAGLDSIMYYELDRGDRQKIDSIKYGIEKIEEDKSTGAHNYILISQLLNQYQSELKSIK